MPSRACHGVASLNSVYYNRFPLLFTWSVFIECLTYTRLRFFFFFLKNITPSLREFVIWGTSKQAEHCRALSHVLIELCEDSYGPQEEVDAGEAGVRQG